MRILTSLICFLIMSKKTLCFNKLFSFGVISDIQYCSFPDSLNFQKTKLRRYKQSFHIFEEATKKWKQNNAIFSLILGDFIDGRARTRGDHYQCFQRITNVSVSSNIPHHFTFGNHCHYCFDRKELASRIANNIAAENTFLDTNTDSIPLFYDFSPYPGWRFISVDGYDLSIIGSRSKEEFNLAYSMLTKHNPNELANGNKWIKNLPDYKRRWLPYNGGLGENQIIWLQRKLDEFKRNEERVIIFCHQPIFAPNRQTSLIWNAEAVLKLLWRYDNIVLWIAGHDHDGQCTIDPRGIYHIVPPAPIECDLNDSAYGTFHVNDDCLLLDWVGRIPKDAIYPWPQKIHLKEVY